MRRRYVKGKFEDQGQWFRCPKCGFMMKKDRNFPAERMNKTITDVYESSNPYDTHETEILLDELSWLGSVVESEGETYVTNRNVTINVGCPFCGNVNF